MTRAHIADPHIARKVATGEEARIRPCVGATYCLDRIYEGGGALCIHNAATGREAVIPHEIARAETSRRAVIVGAGPAGLEAARVAAERGHEVHLLEAASQAGGQVRLLAANPRRREMTGIVDWRLAELDRLGVTIRYDTYAEAEDVQARPYLHFDIYGWQPSPTPARPKGGVGQGARALLDVLTQGLPG